MRQETKETFDKEIETLENSMADFSDNKMSLEKLTSVIDQVCRAYMTNRLTFINQFSKQEMIAYSNRLNECHKNLINLKIAGDENDTYNFGKNTEFLAGLISEIDDHAQGNHYKDDLFTLYSLKAELENKLQTLPKPGSKLKNYLLFFASVIIYAFGYIEDDGSALFLGIVLFILWMLSYSMYSRRTRIIKETSENMESVTKEIVYVSDEMNKVTPQ